MALRKRNRSNKYSRHRLETVLASIAKCGNCNCALTPTYTEKNKKRYYYYACQRTLKYPDHVCSLQKIAVNELDQIVCFHLSIIFQAYSMREAVVHETGVLLREYCRKLVSERSSTRRMQKFIKDELTQKESEGKMNRLNWKFKSFQNGIPRKRIDRLLESFHVLWNIMPAKDRIELLDNMLKEVRVFPDKVQTILDPDFLDLKLELVSLFAHLGELSTISVENGCIIIETPIVQKRLNGQNKLEMQGHNYEDNNRCLLHSIATSWQWNKMLEDGKVQNITQLAGKVGFAAPYVTRILSLCNLAPSIVADVLSGNIPESFTLNNLYKGIPDDWLEQRKKFGFRIE